MPKLLLDENISIAFRYRPKNAVESIKVLGPGASDQDIIRYAEKHGLTIVSGDRPVTNNQINKGKSVYRVDSQKGWLYEIKVRRVKKLKTKLDPITYYLRSGDRSRVIRP